MVGYDYRHITMSFYLFTENPPYLSKLHFAPVLRALATTIATQWKGSRQKQKVGQKATSFGFALERAANSIPNFPAAVNIVIKKVLFYRVCKRMMLQQTSLANQITGGSCRWRPTHSHISQGKQNGFRRRSEKRSQSKNEFT